MRHGITWSVIGIIAFYVLVLGYPSNSDVKFKLESMGFENIVIPPKITNHFAHCPPGYTPMLSFGATRNGNMIFGTACGNSGKRIEIVLK
jgi:hypothetical protein